MNVFTALKGTNLYIFLQKYVHLGENTFIHCSWITVVHVHVNVFSKIYKVVNSAASNQEVTKKMSDKHTAEYSKTLCWGVN